MLKRAFARMIKSILRYTLRVLLYFWFGVLCFFVLVWVFLPAFLPQILAFGEQRLASHYGIYVDIEEPELTWSGTHPRLRATQMQLSGIQNTKFTIKDIEVTYSSIFDFLLGQPGQADITASEVFISPALTQAEAATVMRVPIKRNPYHQLSGFGKYFDRFEVTAEKIRFSGSPITLNAPQLSMRMEEEIRYQIKVAPTHTIIRDANVSGILTEESQQFSFNIVPSAQASELLTNFGLEPETPFYLRVDSQNFYNNSAPEAHGQIFQGGYRFGEIHLQDDQWRLHHPIHGELGSGFFLLGPGFGWDMAGDLPLNQWLEYFKTLPAYAQWHDGLKVAGNLKFTLSGSSPLVPSNLIILALDAVDIEAPNWQIKGLQGDIDLSNQSNTMLYFFDADRLSWQQPEIAAHGALDAIRLSGSTKPFQGIITLDSFQSKLADSNTVTATVDVDMKNDHITLNIDIPSLRYIDVADMVPIAKTNPFRHWLDEAFTSGSVQNALVRYHGSMRPERLSAQNRLTIEADAMIDSFTYNDNWPTVDKVKTHFRLDNQTLSITDATGAFQGARFATTKSTIQGLLSDPIMQLNIEADGDIESFLAYLDTSPLRDSVSEPIMALQPNNGSVSTKGKLRFPLLMRIPLKPEVLLDIDVKAVDLTLPDGEPIKSASGTLRYGREVGLLESEDLSFRLRDTPARGKLRVETETSPMRIDATIQGAFDSQVLFRGTPFVDYIHGADDWTIQYQQETEQNTTLKLSTPLNRAKLSLPNALKQSTKNGAELVLHTIDAKKAELTFAHKGVVSGAISLYRNQAGDYDIKGGNINIGGQEIPALSSLDALRLNGYLPKIDLNDLMNNQSTLPLDKADFTVSEIIWGSFCIEGNTRIIVAQSPTDSAAQLELTVDGENISGIISLVDEVIWMDFTNLSFVDAGNPMVGSEPIELPLPETLPSVRANIYTLRRNGRNYGTLKFSGDNQGPEYFINNASLDTGNGWIQLSGKLQNLKPFTRVILEAKAGNLGNVVGVFTGIKHMILQKLSARGELLLNQGKTTRLFESGRVSVLAQNGLFYGVNPSALDLLKAINPLWLLANLNNADLEAGFPINTIEAELRLQPNYLAIDKAMLFSDIANIHVHGQITRETQALNLGVGVMPRLTEIGAVAGGLLGGPVAAAITAALAQFAMLDASAPPDILHITGSIKAPEQHLLY